MTDTSNLSKEKHVFIAGLEINDGSISFTSSIQNAINEAYLELDMIDETIDSLKSMKSECDKVDYSLAAGSGALCGIIDIFLVGAPNSSPLGDITDEWFSDRTKDFAKLHGWKGKNLKSAIGFLERHFKVPYDQRGMGDAGKVVAGMNPSNHHFKSLAHNPSLMGIFFSILDQFTNSSHFIGEDIFSNDSKITLISLEQADDGFELRGHNIPSKFFCAFVNWFGHLMSDVSGSSGSKGRGKGIPSPLWTWINDIITIKSKLGLDSSRFEKIIYEFSMQLFTEGYDTRFQSAQAIPVFLNEMVVRLFYMIRRLVQFLSKTDKGNRRAADMWSACNPFSNHTVRRMLTVAHGTFCLLDAGDATIRAIMKGGGTFNPLEFVLRLNIIGVGRFSISLFGEAKDRLKYRRAKTQADFAGRERYIVEYYLDGLRILEGKYDDAELKTFVGQLQNGIEIKDAFRKSSALAELRGAPNILKTKDDIDNHFNRK